MKRFPCVFGFVRCVRLGTVTSKGRQEGGGCSVTIFTATQISHCQLSRQKGGKGGEGKQRKSAVVMTVDGRGSPPPFL